MNSNYDPQDYSYYQASYVPHEARKKKLSFGAVAALCLVFALLGCTITGFALGWGKNEAPAPVTTSTVYQNKALPGEAVVKLPDNIKLKGDGTVYSATEIYAKSCPSCVGISTELTSTNVFGQVTTGSVTGSGFIITEDGYIITNYHVVETAISEDLEITVMLYSGESYTAEVIGTESENDLALLKINASGLTPVVCGDSDSMLVGEDVFVIGNPLGELTYTLTGGMVSALDREISTENSTSINMFQISAAVNSGNSGGPVFNDRNEVIGIVTAKYQSTGVEGLGFAIPINDALAIIGDLMEYGYVTGKPYLGITVVTVTDSNAQYYHMVPGAYIYNIDEDACCNEAGLQIGDIITKMDDYEIVSSSELVAAKKNYHAGDTAVFTYYRDGEYNTVSVTFDEAGKTMPNYGQEEANAPQTTNPFSSTNPFGFNFGFPW